MPDEPRRRVTSFVHQRNRLTEGQAHAWARLWSRFGVDVADVLTGAVRYDPPAWFGRTAPLVLEIGPGTGESTAALASAEPDTDHLAVEVFEPGLARLLMRIEETALTNLRLLRGDAVELLRERVPDASLAGIRIFFPDPWPKRRHRKRRLVQPEFVALVDLASRPRSDPAPGHRLGRLRRPDAGGLHRRTAAGEHLAGRGRLDATAVVAAGDEVRTPCRCRGPRGA